MNTHTVTNEHLIKMLDLIKRLAAVPAPSGQEEMRVSFILNYLHERGIGAYADGAKNVIVPVGTENEGGITVFSAHTDVVFPDLTPLPVLEKDGKLLAPGVGDDTANVAAILTVLDILNERDMLRFPKSPVMFVLNSCEEGLGNLKGTKRLFSDHGGRIKELISFDCDIKGGVVTRAVGSERWRVTARTEGGHSYSAFGKPNAIHILSKLVSRLYEQELPDIKNARATYNVGVIKGGTSVNTIAQNAEMLYEYRSDSHEALSFMRESFNKLIAGARSDGSMIETELIGERPCGCGVDGERHEALIKRCESVIKAVTGRTFGRSSASTDANIPLSLGVPAVTLGLFSGGGAHTREEWLDLDSLEAGLGIALGLITESCF
ncbi:MAG: M20/M25/M40 family metallo-hydrolase [Clostridiales bacterium]|nr:M20/M25/M40 family metallo-hydrolase [Clostridiales bacterium]